MSKPKFDPRFQMIPHSATKEEDGPPLTEHAIFDKEVVDALRKSGYTVRYNPPGEWYIVYPGIDTDEVWLVGRRIYQHGTFLSFEKDVAAYDRVIELHRKRIERDKREKGI